MLRFRPALFAALLVTACAPPPPLPAQYAAASFVTNAEVPLRFAPADTSATVALLPAGTPLLPLDTSPGKWRVDSPLGVGWVYTGYIGARPR